MLKTRFLLVLVAVFFVVSCSKLQYIDQAFAIKAYSDEREAQGSDVAQRDALFEKLLAGVRSGRTQQTVRTAAELARQFGLPVLKNEAPGTGGAEWLYRYQVKHQGPKIYVAVGPDGRIDGFRLEE